jgi:hypothetical protein
MFLECVSQEITATLKFHEQVYHLLYSGAFNSLICRSESSSIMQDEQDQLFLIGKAGISPQLTKNQQQAILHWGHLEADCIHLYVRQPIRFITFYSFYVLTVMFYAHSISL